MGLGGRTAAERRHYGAERAQGGAADGVTVVHGRDAHLLFAHWLCLALGVWLLLVHARLVIERRLQQGMAVSRMRFAPLALPKCKPLARRCTARWRDNKSAKLLNKHAHASQDQWCRSVCSGNVQSAGCVPVGLPRQRLPSWPLLAPSSDSSPLLNTDTACCSTSMHASALCGGAREAGASGARASRLQAHKGRPIASPPARSHDGRFSASSASVTGAHARRCEAGAHAAICSRAVPAATDCPDNLASGARSAESGRPRSLTSCSAYHLAGHVPR